jgi:transposase-like protein
VRDAIPHQTHQPEAHTWLKTLPYAETRVECERFRDQFRRRYRLLAPKAVERVPHDWERLLPCYQFPKAPWRQLRTTNVVESPFAAVRLRTTAGNRSKRVESATALIWKVLQVAEQTFRRLNAPELLPAVYTGTPYVDGIRQHHVAQQEVAV